MGYAYGCFVEVKNNVPNSETRHSTFVKAECPDQSCLVLELELNSKPLCKFWSFLIKKKEKKIKDVFLGVVEFHTRGRNLK